MHSLRRIILLAAVLGITILLALVSMRLPTANLVQEDRAGFIRARMRLASNQCPTISQKILFLTDLLSARQVPQNLAFDANGIDGVTVTDAILLSTAMLGMECGEGTLDPTHPCNGSPYVNGTCVASAGDVASPVRQTIPVNIQNPWKSKPSYVTNPETNVSGLYSTFSPASAVLASSPTGTLGDVGAIWVEGLYNDGTEARWISMEMNRQIVRTQYKPCQFGCAMTVKYPLARPEEQPIGPKLPLHIFYPSVPFATHFVVGTGYEFTDPYSKWLEWMGGTGYWEPAGRVNLSASIPMPANVTTGSFEHVRIHFLKGTCGDGYENNDEYCDDGNQTDTDACPNSCQDSQPSLTVEDLTLNQCGNDLVVTGTIRNAGQSRYNMRIIIKGPRTLIHEHTVEIGKHISADGTLHITIPKPSTSQYREQYLAWFRFSETQRQRTRSIAAAARTEPCTAARSSSQQSSSVGATTSAPPVFQCFRWRKNYNSHEIVGRITNFDPVRHVAELAFNGNTYKTDGNLPGMFDASGKFQMSLPIKFVGCGLENCDFYEWLSRQGAGVTAAPAITIRDRTSNQVVIQEYAARNDAPNDPAFTDCSMAPPPM